MLLEKDAGLKENVAAAATAIPLIFGGITNHAKEVSKSESAIIRDVVKKYNKAFEIDSTYLSDDAVRLMASPEERDSLISQWKINAKLIKEKIKTEGPITEEIEAAQKPDGINLYRYNLRYPMERLGK